MNSQESRRREQHGS